MKSITLEADIHFQRRGRGARRVMETGPNPQSETPVGRLPRITRLMGAGNPVRRADPEWRGHRLRRTGPPRPRLPRPRHADHEPADAGPQHSGGNPASAARDQRPRPNPSAATPAHRTGVRLAEAAEVVVPHVSLLLMHIVLQKPPKPADNSEHNVSSGVFLIGEPGNCRQWGMCD